MTCRCPDSQLKYEGISNRPRGKEMHIWKCQKCGRYHVTQDKQKPNRSGGGAVRWWKRFLCWAGHHEPSAVIERHNELLISVCERCKKRVIYTKIRWRALEKTPK